MVIAKVADSTRRMFTHSIALVVPETDVYSVAEPWFLTKQ
jgi:hypothetical protein